MIDKTLDVFLMILFGAGGILILVFVSLQSEPLAERPIPVLVGSLGILWVAVRLRKLFLMRKQNNTYRHRANIEQPR